LIVRNAKGKKDRVLLLPGNTLTKLLESHIEAMSPESYIKEGQTKGRKYSATNFENIFIKYLGREKQIIILRFIVCNTVTQHVYWKRVKNYATFRNCLEITAEIYAHGSK